MTLARLIQRLLLIGLLCAAAVILTRAPLLSVLASGVARMPQQGQVVGEGPNRAALVVRYSDNSVDTRCVRFSEAEISGGELLERSGLGAIIAPEGTVCSINGTGCPSDDCWCECPYPQCVYWAYYHWLEGAWSYSSVGAVGAQGWAVTDGATEGWSWGQGQTEQGDEPPPDITFDQICSAAADTPTPTATATTQTIDATNPPQANLVAYPASVVSGQCATISWQTVNASTVILNGTSVAAQGNRQECPTAMQVWTLVASNAAGQTTRQVTLQVTGAAATATPGVTASPAAGGSQTVTPAPGGAQTATPSTRVLQPTVPAQQLGGLPQTPASQFTPAPTAAANLVGGVPLAPTAEPPVVVTLPPQPTATRFVFSLPPTATPRPRRTLGADGRPTPTPILVASLPAAPAGGEPAAGNPADTAGLTDAARRLAESRSFSPQLLPGYAAYLLTLAVLAVIGWTVLHRKGGRRVATSAEPAPETPRRSHEVNQ